MAEKKTQSFSAEERAAMKERAKELKANATKEAGVKDALAKIAEMPEADRVLRLSGDHQGCRELQVELIHRGELPLYELLLYQELIL